MKYGFYELQSARDWYREVSAESGMHKDLVLYWIRISALLATPVAPHFAEHIWSDILQEPKSIQWASWPTPEKPVDQTIIEAGFDDLPRAVADTDPALIRTSANLIPLEIDPLRVIDIVGLDRQADGGTHVANTREVGGIRVTGYESKGRINKRIRIELVEPD